MTRKVRRPASEAAAAVAGPLRAALVAWFRTHARDYPWRRTQDAYAILVSEMMLQQTQIATVLGRGYYSRWMERFPDVRALAAAGEADILKAWEGLGYYSRARNLQRAAATVVDRYAGRFPDTLEEITALPGVGRYTAGAVLSFAFDKPAPIVDGNVARVLARLFSIQEEINTPAGQGLLWDVAEKLTDPAHPRLYNSAVMELGQRVCTVRQPDCAVCPVNAFCQSAGPAAAALPRKKPGRETVLQEEHVIWALRPDGSLLLIQETGRRRKGLWRLPLRPPEELAGLPLVSRARYAITHHRVTLLVYALPDAPALAGETWHPWRTLPELAMPGPFRRVVDALTASLLSTGGMPAKSG